MDARPGTPRVQSSSSGGASVNQLLEQKRKDEGNMISKAEKGDLAGAKAEAQKVQADTQKVRLQRFFLSLFVFLCCFLRFFCLRLSR